MKDWGNESWRQQGRTGPNGPRYASRSDRANVRRGRGPRDPQPKGCGKAAASAFLIALAITGGLGLGVAEVIRRVVS